jgi:hypothetical protein
MTRRRSRALIISSEVERSCASLEPSMGITTGPGETGPSVAGVDPRTPLLSGGASEPRVCPVTCLTGIRRTTYDHQCVDGRTLRVGQSSSERCSHTDGVLGLERRLFCPTADLETGRASTPMGAWPRLLFTSDASGPMRRHPPTVPWNDAAGPPAHLRSATWTGR